ncbi:hypothetical protein [Streptomyces lavendulae]|uniref:hypothetical protein n=1 Tax=Streptomyces lavendulae TaxID=1914 RepID=UPI0024A24D59|nr:hypothetical protein [Streptomyces lavendulae]GLX22874.1 hypothetical protein Slala01_65180 [Streptomyces lavendulae subsp. lavendulae]GLX24402.1 hypothetical protein Slala02_02220 [Streptomyces lavendulae subsp. lavendulae]
MIIIPTSTEHLLAAAARNNAEWCAAVSRSGHFRDALWCSPRRTPPLYPDAVTLTPGATAAEVLAGVDTAAPGCSVKDSFAALDLTSAGFEVLFEAQWIHRPPGPSAPPTGRLEWHELEAPGELAAWETAWNGGESTGLFHEGLLREGIVFLAGRDGSRITAGAVLSTGGGVVGVSNVFAHDAHDHADADAAWAAALDAAARHWPELPVVGYEHGEDLDTAARAGFTPLGPLRIWLHTA